MALTIRTNHVPRFTIDGFDLTLVEREEFDYMTQEEIDNGSFFRFKGQVYDISQFTRIPASIPEFASWHGMAPDSTFSGVLIHLSSDQETVVVAQYFS